MPAVTAATAAAAAPAAAVAAPRGKKKLLILVAAVLAVVLASGAGGVWILKKRAAAAAAATADDDGAAAEVAQAGTKHDPKGIPVYLPLDPFIVNLADKDVDRYAQIGITLELESPVFADQVKAYMPAVRNAILLILAQKSSKDLVGRSGKEELAEEIMREAVRPMGIEILAPEPVTGANGDADKAGQEEAPAKAKKAKKNAVRNPIQHVHFSSFIIQ